MAKRSVDEIERTVTDTITDEKKAYYSSKVDKEVAKYMSKHRIDISPEKNNELRKKIDRRVLSIMIATYFLQAIDKGTMSFASIMGIREDTGLLEKDQSVSILRDVAQRLKLLDTVIEF